MTYQIDEQKIKEGLEELIKYQINLIERSIKMRESKGHLDALGPGVILEDAKIDKFLDLESISYLKGLPYSAFAPKRSKYIAEAKKMINTHIKKIKNYEKVNN
jgi:hypothetical protein